jgi:hypothetical protein
MRDALRSHESPFSLTRGGPFHRLLVRLRLRPAAGARGMSRAWWLGLAVWLPLVIGDGLRVAVGLRLDPALLDLSVHVRLLFALPIVLLSEQLLERTTSIAVTSFYQGRFCHPAPVDRILAGAERLRDAWLVEGVLLAVALIGGQLVLWEVFGTTGWVRGGTVSALWSFPRLWYALVALPLVQFVILRALWRWVIWCYVLARISRLPLATLATHADLAAGLAPLARPVEGFSGLVLATSAVLAGAWGSKLLDGRTTLDALLPGLATFLLIATVVALAPLLMFSARLYRTRRRALAQYGDFVRDYALRFHRKWIERAPDGADPLGSHDIVALADIGHAYEVIARTRVFVFGPRAVLEIWLAGILPMLPLFASALPLQQVLKRIATTVLGGFPL